MGNLNGRIERIERNIGPPPKRETDRESLLSLPPEERAKRLNAIFERIRLKEEQERLSGRPPEPKTLERTCQASMRGIATGRKGVADSSRSW